MHPFVRYLALPSAVVTAALVASGRALVAYGGENPREDEIVRALQKEDSPGVVAASRAISTASGVGVTVLAGAATCAAVYAVTGNGRRAAAPGVALALETAIFVGASSLIGRSRPHVPRPDFTHATSSFPSGHTAATTALSHTIANLLPRRGWWELLKLELRVDVPGIVGLSRLHRGQHHPSDVVAGWALGAWTSHAVSRALLDN